MSSTQITHNQKHYAILNLNDNYRTLVDYDVLPILQNNQWMYHIKNGRIVSKRYGKNVYMHRVIAENHIDNPNKYKFVIHLNRNFLDNRIANLMWVPKIHQHTRRAKTGKTPNGINVDEIPQCVSWVESKDRGGYFEVKLPNGKKRKSTQSQGIDAKAKLQQIKKTLDNEITEMRKDNSIFLVGYSDELCPTGKQLLSEYDEIMANN